MIVSGKPKYINETDEQLYLGGNLMGTGRKPGGASQTTVTTRAAKKESSKGTEASSTGQDRRQQSPPCWEFRLENTVTKAIQAVSAGTPVQGQPIGSRILVAASQVGELGRAPEGISKRIIKAQQNNGGGLGGTVIEHHRTNVKVKLCLQ
jgi:hypothetical protein